MFQDLDPDVEALALLDPNATGGVDVEAVQSLLPHLHGLPKVGFHNRGES